MEQVVKKKYTYDQEIEMVNLYLEGKGTPEIGKLFGSQAGVIYNILKRHNTQTRTKRTAALNNLKLAQSACRVFSDREEKELVTLYCSGLTIKELSAEYGRSRAAVRNALIRQECPRRSREQCRKFKLNELAFIRAEDNENSSYFAGLIFADGCVYKKTIPYDRNVLCLCLTGEDGVVVERLRDFLETQHPVRIITTANGLAKNSQTRPRTLLHIDSRILVESLAPYGIVPRKSLTATVSEVMLNNRNWWRGVVDGDGWVTYKEGNSRVGLTGSKQTCESFKKWVSTITDTKANVRPNNSVWAFTVAGWHAFRVAKELYGNADHDLAIPRKLAAARQIIQAFSGRKPRSRWSTQ